MKRFVLKGMKKKQEQEVSHIEREIETTNEPIDAENVTMNQKNSKNWFFEKIKKLKIAQKDKKPKKPRKEMFSLKVRLFFEKFSLPTIILLSMLLDLFIESVSRFSMVAAILFFIEKPGVFFYNSFLIFATLTLSYLFKRRFFTTVFISFIWMILGIANGAVLSYRITPFTGTDMKLINSAISLITKYMTIDQIILTIIVALLVIFLILYVAVRGPIYTKKIKYFRNLVLVALALLAIIPVTSLGVKTKVLSTYFGNISIAYEDYGFPYCFWCTVLARGIDMPNDYSEEAVEAIAEEDGEDSFDIDETPNLIFVQLESFIDPEEMKGYTFSQDPIPTFRSLTENYSTGYLTVPVVGAGTANTEFEILTGMTLRYFGPGEYPYKTILKDNVAESLAYDLKSIGYTAHAIHNNEGSFYSRTRVFSRLGFDTFTSEEVMDINGYTPLGWADDDTLAESIMDCLKDTKGQDFVYTITVQSHGGYPSEKMIEDPLITVSGDHTDGENNSMEYYVNQLHDVDAFIAELIEDLNEFEEDTIVVLYGDHQPSLGQTAAEMKNGSLYETTYVIWDNMDLPVVEEDITSYQLAATVMDRIDMHVGTLFKYHQENMNDSQYLPDLQMLQYDMLYGKQYIYGQTIPFTRTNIEMGIRDVTISDVESDGNGNLIITGKNYNAYCQVRINGELYETTYVNDETLLVENAETQKGDILRVDEITAAGTVYRQGVIYIDIQGGGIRTREYY